MGATGAWEKCEHYRDWGLDADRLGGKKLQDDEKVEVQWPDRTVTRHKVRVTRHANKYSDMGHVYDGVDRQAAITVTVRGLDVPVALRGNNLLLRRLGPGQSLED
jgi:hypothetical protein